MDENAKKLLSERIVTLRRQVAGDRGKSKFAKQLGISPSTYDYYENGRVPPAEILLRMAEIAEVDLHWLLTGRESQPGVGADHPILRRAAALLADRPDAAEPLAAFLDVLAQTLAMQPDAAATADQPSLATLPPAEASAATTDPAPAAPAEIDAWIPVLGRSAAGVPRGWAEAGGRPAGETTLADLLVKGRAQPTTRRDAQLAVDPADETPADTTVQLVTLRAPAEPWGTAEFLDAPALRARTPDAFALRIDGDSMSPGIAEGDLVVLSPSRPAQPGRAAVVQVRGAIGVTCKRYEPAGPGRIRLRADNPDVPATDVPADQIDWALAVLARVRPTG